jgi:hypothetical protein
MQAVALFAFCIAWRARKFVGAVLLFSGRRQKDGSTRATVSRLSTVARIIAAHDARHVVADGVEPGTTARP